MHQKSRMQSLWASSVKLTSHRIARTLAICAETLCSVLQMSMYVLGHLHEQSPVRYVTGYQSFSTQYNFTEAFSRNAATTFGTSPRFVHHFGKLCHPM